MFSQCPKCGHKPLPDDQAMPASCPACGVILAKAVRALKEDEYDIGRTQPIQCQVQDEPSILESLTRSPVRMDIMSFWSRVALLVGFAIWGLVLISHDYRTGEIGASFIHKPLLIFHEAGHVVFRLLGEWMMVLGGSLGQLVMPAILGGALLVKNRDPFGASMGLWLLGVSLLDLAPYMYDALHPQLMLLSGMTGEEGGHDWIFLFSSLGLMQKSQLIGSLVHKFGALTVILAAAWGAWVLKLEYAWVCGGAHNS